MGLWNGLLKPLRRRAYLSTGERKIFQRCVALLRRIRVLEVVRPAAGGMKRHVQGLVQGLDKDRFEVLLAAPKDVESGQWVGMEGVECIPLEISGRTPAPGDVVACLKLKNLIKAVRPDICHFHGFKAAAIGRVAVAAMNGPKVVYTAHNSVLSRLNAHLPQAMSSITDPTQFQLCKFQGKMCLYVERTLARFTNRVITVSKDIYEQYSAIPHLGPEKVSYIPNGIDPKRFSPTAHFGDRERERAKRAIGCAVDIPVVGLVSRLIPHKGVKTFLLAVASLWQVGLAPQVLIAGDGPSRLELEAFSLGLGFGDQVRFLGFIDDMESFYEALDVFVLSSFSEGMPLALIEAMAAGVPVVATRTGGVEEVVSASAGGSEGVIISDRGRLVPPGDPEAMATCIQKALLFPQESRMLSDKGKAYVRENFSIEQMVRKTEEVYEEVLVCRD